ncbi:MAG: FMN-dependent NADH-azoreductase [Candidatus Wallacebacter cryptica]|jgi:FMN-dependent NADH-azoreductase|nr:FMN-dependent NADH-azoreductase [Bacillota bacterium]
MAKLLYIKANPKPENRSRTLQISESFIDAYRQYHPNDQIITLDLYAEKIQWLTEEDLKNAFKPDAADDRNHPVLKYAHQFAEADKYVIAEPLWNLGIPAILKAYFDYVCIPGITFKYTEQGAVGLCKGKKAVNIVTRGGLYSDSPAREYELGDRYVWTIMRFLGINDYETIFADGLDLVGSDVEAIIGAAIKQAQEKASDF